MILFYQFIIENLFAHVDGNRNNVLEAISLQPKALCVKLKK